MFFSDATTLLNFVQKWVIYNWAEVNQTTSTGSVKDFLFATASLDDLKQKLPANTTIVISLTTDQYQNFNSMSLPRYEVGGTKAIGQVEFYHLSPKESQVLKLLRTKANVPALNTNQVLDVLGNVLTQVTYTTHGVGYV